MKRILSILLIICFFTGKSQEIRSDYFKHYCAGIAITGMAASTIYFFTGKQVLSTVGGALIGITAGIAKEEIYDRQWGLGVPSNKDKIATAQGAGACYFYMNVFLGLSRVNKTPIDTTKYNFTNPCRYLN